MVKIGKATLHRIDCMEYMSILPDKLFDLAIVDPPYGIDCMQRMRQSQFTRSGEKYTSKTGSWINYKAKSWDNAAPDQSYFDELLRVSKNQIVWGANMLSTFLPINKKWIVWHKTVDGLNHGKCDLAWTSIEGSVDYVKIFMNEQSGFLQYKDFGRIHPTQKPIKLYEHLLTNYAKPGQRILDTHLGSGSSSIACNNLGYEMVGCELDEDYYTAACARVEQATKQERLFV